MQPAEAPDCEIRNALRSSLRAQMTVYRRAIADLEKLIFDAHRGTPFDQALERARQARDKFQDARILLEQHIGEHGCE